MQDQENIIKVFIVEDKKMMIDGIKSMLDKATDIDLIGFTQKASEAPSLIAVSQPDVIIMDFEFEHESIDGIEIATQILESHPANILMLTNYDEFALIKQAFKNGIKGYVPKNTSKFSLLEGIRKVAAGKLYFDPVMATIFDEPNSSNNPSVATVNKQDNNESDLRHPLTKRELDVALVCAEGKSRKEIANELYITLNTVDTHFKNIYGKLGINNNTGLTHWLHEKGLI